MVDPVSFGAVKVATAKPMPTDVTPKRSSVAANVSNAKIETAQSLPELIGLAQQLVEQGVPVDYTKVAQIRTAIAQGSYHASHEDVAGAMLGFDGKEVK